MAGCGAFVRPVTPAVVAAAQAQGLPADPVTLEHGRNVYLQHCGECHGLRSTDKLSPSRWRSALAEMSPKAKLTRVEQDHVTAYILAAHAVRDP